MSTSDLALEQPDAQLQHDSSITVDKAVSLTLSSDSLLVLDERSNHKSNRGCCAPCKSNIDSPKTVAISLYNILDAEINPTSLVITYAEHSHKDDVTVTALRYKIGDKEKPAVEAWMARLLDLAYGAAERRKRLKVLINPHGGKGNAASLYQKYAAPIFAAARCQLDVQATEYNGHAIKIAEELDIDAYDTVVCCSGDGLPYEVFNGLGKRPNGREALARVAVALLPCGSGNGLTWNCFGTGSNSIAALGIVKGLRTPLDLVSVTQKDSRTLSFLSQSFGIVAESDLATEHIRWMGAQRFTYGFLVRLLRRTVWPCDLAIKVVLDDKQAIKEHYRSYRLKGDEDADSLSDQKRIDAARKSPELPELQFGTVQDELPGDWETVPGETMGNFYAGNMAIMSKDTNFFPASLPNDGLMDVVTIDGNVSRSTSLKMMTEIETGGFFDMPEVKIRKAMAYRLVPRQKEGYISIDGERVPFEAFQCEVHPGLGTVLSKSKRIYEAEGPR
ncbi:hypothetical protein N7539_002725 [Penicillium diatomitis]|uniref:DAGKc domain-containing protein n=1 Tax=Penicillium diatomitis TaxID=2819901 RepID=A0A9X0BZD1_9EURO|nr:uncharacterized protein N7539_002725 [Penicillium diatomitis]KAJ5491158.1 hypothetical protein N7539_002725 [Penicillium diatomitis]